MKKFCCSLLAVLLFSVTLLAAPAGAVTFAPPFEPNADAVYLVNLDTGIVVDHPNFGALSEDKLTESSLTKEGVDAIWNTLNAGQMTSLRNRSYYNSKLPFIFNYYTRDFDVSHATAQHDHGTHVAGITAANKIEGSSVIGVAPDAQIIVMQVFSAGGGAGWDTIMAGLEDCVRLDVDACNLSLPVLQ